MAKDSGCYVGNYEFQVPIFVLTHVPPRVAPKQDQQLLRAGLVDELHLDVMPVLLGAGLRFFEKTGLEHLKLERIGVQEIGPRTSLRFHIQK